MSDFDQHLAIFISVAIGFIGIAGFLFNPLRRDARELRERVTTLETRLNDWRERDHVPRADYDRDRAQSSRDHDQIVINTNRLTEIERRLQVVNHISGAK